MSKEAKENSLFQMGFILGEAQKYCSHEEMTDIYNVLLAHMPWPMVQDFHAKRVVTFAQQEMRNAKNDKSAGRT